MSRITSIVLVVMLTLLAGLFLYVDVIGQVGVAAAQSAVQPGGPGEDGGWPQVRATGRISIPYGIEPVLPLGPNGLSVEVRGHGGCTAGETVAVQISLTHHMTDVTIYPATGRTELPCTGQLDHWSLTASSTTPLPAGSAEACGVATTRANGNVTDTFEWCRDVELAWQSLLPAVLSQPSP